MRPQLYAFIFCFWLTLAPTVSATQYDCVTLVHKYSDQTYDLPTWLTESAGGYAARDLVPAWEAIVSWEGGKRYGHYLLKWAKLLDETVAPGLGAIFLQATANRPSDAHADVTQWLSPLPSIPDLDRGYRIFLPKPGGRYTQTLVRNFETMISQNVELGLERFSVGVLEQGNPSSQLAARWSRCGLSPCPWDPQSFSDASGQQFEVRNLNANKEQVYYLWLNVEGLPALPAEILEARIAIAVENNRGPLGYAFELPPETALTIASDIDSARRFLRDYLSTLANEP